MKTAFEKYLLRKHGNNPEAIATELEGIAVSNPSGQNIVWGYLSETGDNVYTRDTFLKVAKEIIKPAKS